MLEVLQMGSMLLGRPSVFRGWPLGFSPGLQHQGSGRLRLRHYCHLLTQKNSNQELTKAGGLNGRERARVRLGPPPGSGLGPEVGPTELRAITGPPPDPTLR